jgi:hypothetical protein
METAKIIQSIDRIKVLFIENIKNIDKHLPKLTKRRREMTKINKIKDDKVIA